MIRTPPLALPLALFAVLLPAAAFAHTGIGAHGAPFVSGLAHPVLGADHMLAMVAIGLFAALTGGRATWAYPATFLAAMLAGGLLGFAGVPVPLVEPAILASVVVLGAAVAFALRLPPSVACPAIAVFGLAHGFAHGLEGPELGGAAYAAGFVVSTAALHGLGLALGFAAARVGQPAVTRALGGLTGLAGVALILG